jgi:hypothetical protein
VTLTIEDIRNPDRQSGFDYVGIGGYSAGGRGQPNWRAQRRTGRGSFGRNSWRGPSRRDPAVAAQDYCDYINGQTATPATLRTAGHQYDAKAADRDPEVEAALGVLRDARAQRNGVPGYVYLIVEDEDGGALRYGKIGYSVNPEKRVAELQTGNPRLLRLLYKMQGTLEDERRLHAKYAKDNVLQEWFEVTKELVLEFPIQPAAASSGGRPKEVS